MAITISGSGIVEANLADNAVTLAKMASGTDGEILTYDASGNPTSVSVGTDGQVLTSTGAGSPPAFEAAAAGGKVLQVVSSTSSTKVDVSSSTWTDLGLTVSITPSSTTSKILIFAHCPTTVKASNNCYSNIKLYRSVPVTATLIQNNRFEERHGYDHTTYWSINYIDSPATTSECTYKLQGKNDLASGTATYVLDISDAGLSSITVMEIGA